MVDFALCPQAPHGPRACGMVAVQVDAEGNRWVCTACYAVNGGGVREQSVPTRNNGQAEASSTAEPDRSLRSNGQTCPGAALPLPFGLLSRETAAVCD